MATGPLKAFEVELKTKEFRLFQELMYKLAGVHLPESKHALVKNRLQKRLAALGLTNYKSYYDYICTPQNNSELQQFMNAITTNETYFFRHKSHWDFFLLKFIPAWKQHHSQNAMLKVWSAASSTGEEPYTIAIALKESFPENTSGRIMIDASDINEDVLKRAQQATYNKYALQKVTPLCVRKYFRYNKATDKYLVNEEVRKLVNFRKHNLMAPVQGKRYDLIFIRNVLIYFDEKSKSRVLENILRVLEPGGYMILGGAESLGTHNDKFTYVQPTIYRKK